MEDRKMGDRDRDRDRGDRDRGDRDRGDRDSGGGSRRKNRPPLDLHLDYKDVNTLKSFLTEEGKLVPSRISKLNRKQQTVLTREVKRARILALLPFSSSQMGR